MSSQEDGGGRAPDTATKMVLVERSAVPAGLPYREYREYLRYDFFYSCAYCTMFETEAHAIRFTIDHYEPQAVQPKLKDEYTNLMWACDECNTRKGDRCPPAGARAAGYRFFRPDHDVREDHFGSSGIRIEPKSNIGYYSIEAIDLNRASLRRLREIRKRLYDAGPLVADGVSALKRFQIDQLPPSVKGKAHTAMRRMERVAEKFENDIDALLRSFARSALIDPDTDPDAETRAKGRIAKLDELQGLYPGQWKASRKGSR
jgi:hypothetical protein